MKKKIALYIARVIVVSRNHFFKLTCVFVCIMHISVKYAKCRSVKKCGRHYLDKSHTVYINPPQGACGDSLYTDGAQFIQYGTFCV